MKKSEKYSSLQIIFGTHQSCCCLHKSACLASHFIRIIVGVGGWRCILPLYQFILLKLDLHYLVKSTFFLAVRIVKLRYQLAHIDNTSSHINSIYRIRSFLNSGEHAYVWKQSINRRHGSKSSIRPRGNQAIPITLLCLLSTNYTEWGSKSCEWISM